MGAEVSIDRVTHRFARHSAVAAVEDLELRIAAGECIALIGESGCGKSTLLRMLAGLLIPDKGSIHIGGRRVSRPDANWNLMFQRPALYPWLNVRENVALGLRFAGRCRGLEARVDTMLALVGLADRGRARVQDLSGGQQQRVALARSLSLDPELLLLDEPFSALDTITRRTLQSEVGRIVRACGITSVVVTHDIEEAVTLGDRVVLMSPNPGRLRAFLSVDLPHPRAPAHPDFLHARERVLRAFEDIRESGSALRAADSDSEFLTDIAYSPVPGQ